MPSDSKLAVVHEDLEMLARLHLRRGEVTTIDSYNSFFVGEHEYDGLIVAAEEGAAWNVLYPEYAVVVPQPIVHRPVCMMARAADDQWLRFLDRRLDVERLGGSLDRLRTYWVEGGGTQERSRRWCLLRDVLHWIP
jgi:hypothetical protein